MSRSPIVTEKSDVVCHVCGKKFQVINSRRNKAKFCSYDCYHNSMRIKKEKIWDMYYKDSNGCWIFTGTPSTGNGYKRFTLNGKQTTAHRASYIIANGDIPDGMFVCHKCDNPACINPEHLFLGTHQDNMDDMKKKGRAARICHLGTKSPRAKFTKEQVLEIRSSDKTTRAIASFYGVSHGVIWAIKTKKSYKDVI